MIKFRIDVDYAYPSRPKSFLHTALNIKIGKDYLRNAKIIARMINESPKTVKAYWFFTSKTVPDRELLDMLNKRKHEVALHIVNYPYDELKLLEKTTGRKLNYYTIHGTARLLGRVIWKRWKTKAPEIPKKFPLESFHEYPFVGLDWFCYKNSSGEAFQVARKSIAEGKVLHIHPVWLFQRGKTNRRGSFYSTLRRLLSVDHELETVNLKKKLFFKIARNTQDYVKDVIPRDDFIMKLAERGIDVFTFAERKWCSIISHPPRLWLKTEENIALLQIASYEDWWKNVGKKTRNMVRKAEKSGIKTEVVETNEKLVEGIWKIYNETPIRQERAFPHYGLPLQTVRELVFSVQNCTFIGSFLQNELVGFIQLIHGDKTAIISQILSLQKHWDKAVNNALIAKAMKFCASNKIEWVMYGRMGNHPSLDKFKESNSFSKFTIARYYIPITWKGKLAVKLGLHREIKDVVPERLKHWLIPLYNWTSRNMRIR